jgi:hypothetical protein
MSQPPGAQNKALQIVAWAISLLSCLYFVWTYIQVSRYTKVFSDMFASMGVELPTQTRFLLSSNHWLYPMLFVGAGVLVVVKEAFMRDKKVTLATTFGVVLCVLWAVGWINSALYAPLFSLIEKLKG